MASEPEPVAWAREEAQNAYYGSFNDDRRIEIIAAALLAAERRGRDAERERCAKIADEAAQLWRASKATEIRTTGLGAIYIAAAIRKGDAT